MPDLATRADRERELAAAVLLVLRDGRASGTMSVDRLAVALRDPLRQTYLDACQGMILASASENPPEISEDAIEAEAAAWVDGYAPVLARQIVDSTTSLADVADDLEAVFGAARAEMIAATEVTRAISAAEAYLILLWADEADLQYRRIWHTEHDGKVCPVCKPLDRAPEEVWGTVAPSGPPAHPNCRCWLDYQVS